MGRVRGNPRGGATGTNSKEQQRKSLSSYTGAVGGGGLAAYAINLPDPYKQILIMSAPSISIVVAKFGPGFLDGLAKLVRYLGDWATHEISMIRLRMFLSNQRKRLAEANLPQDRQEEIARRISEAEIEIDDRVYRRISPFLVGDDQAGLRSTSSPTNSPPPSSGDDSNG